MPRRLAQLVAVLLVPSVGLAACGDSSGSGAATAAEDRVVGVVYDIGGLGDGGLNDLAYAAFGRAEDDLGITVEAIEPDPSGDDRADLVRSLAGNRTGLVLALGRGARAAVDEVANEHPGIAFVVVDDGVSTLANVTSVTFAEEQGAYLVGAAAALASPAKRIGFVGGREDESTKRYQAGYTAGARAVDPSMRVDVGYLPAAPEGAAVGLEPATSLARAQVTAGADVLFGAPRELGAALTAAAVERGGAVRSIGIDIDAMETADAAVRSVVLASMLKNFGGAITEVLKRFVEGRLAAGSLRLGLARDGVDLSVAGGLLSADALARIDDLRGQILGGQIQVPTAP